MGKKSAKNKNTSFKITELFKNKGIIANKFIDYEYREEQEILANKINNAFEKNSFLVSEAGTGTGKSLAYLFPSILKSFQREEPVIIATHTKNLQEQLFYKDIPSTQSIINQDFQAVLLKGKSNYLCLDKWYRYTDIDNKSLNNFERNRLVYLVYWLYDTASGDIEENTAFSPDKNISLWLKFTAENNYCYGRKCPHYDDCFLMKARNQARIADIIVINHAMLFSNLLLPNSILGDFQYLVLDEAHNLEKIAADYLGADVNYRQIHRIIIKILSNENKGILVELNHKLESHKHQIDELELKSIFIHINSIEKLIKELDKALILFFSKITERLEHMFQDKQDKLRYQGKLFFKNEADEIDNCISLMENLSHDCFDLHQQLNLLNADTFPNQVALVQDFLSSSQDLSEISMHFQSLCLAETENYVFWIERQLFNNDYNYSFHMAPIDIRSLMHQLLFQKLESAIFTSATLSSQNNFDYFIKRMGLDLVENERLDKVLLGSPFKMDEQCSAMLISYLPDPGNNQYVAMLNEFLIEIADKRKNGILVLFTNYSMMHQLAKLFQNAADKLHRDFLVQGRNGSRSQIIEKMKSLKNTIVFGNDSFWEGIDIPGEALETLVITKLPFAVPDDPIVSARSELLKKQGLNPFMEYSVPDAIIKFRQGFGRLIRTKSDNGIVFFTDNRLVNKQYGKHFLDSLPVKTTIISNSQQLKETLELI